MERCGGRFGFISHEKKVRSKPEMDIRLAPCCFRERGPRLSREVKKKRKISKARAFAKSLCLVARERRSKSVTRASRQGARLTPQLLDEHARHLLTATYSTG